MKTFPKFELMDCPGAWYGTATQDVIAADGPGHVVVDPKNTVDALRWLNRRVSRVTVENVTTDGGLFIRFQSRGRPVEMPHAV